MATMTKDELLEEIRSRLREPQLQTVETPWEYREIDLVMEIRSALRYLRVIGVPVTATMSPVGALGGTLDENVGIAIACWVSSRLFAGDLARKLGKGELGVYFRAGPDIIDTRNVNSFFAATADAYEGEFKKLVAIILASGAENQNAILSDREAWA